MSMPNDEKRTHPRVILKIEDGYFGHFKTAGQERIVAPIVNLSVGGINIAVPESNQGHIQEGQHLVLQSIAGGTNLSFLSEVPAEIRWIKKQDKAGYVSVGCQFNNLPDAVRQQLNQFVHSERMVRGQYD